MPAVPQAVPTSHEPVDVTIAIVTRNRRDELRDAVRSAVQQAGAVEVLVLDDGSSDGTAEMVRAEFPGVRVERFDDDAGVAARRNDAARLARGDIIVSIDDDAVFTSPRTVAEMLADFDHPRIAAVAMPYIDIGGSPEVQQRAPDADERWITCVYRATAYAIRRDVLLELGGYDGAINQFGEEWDVSLRLMDAGYVIRLGRSEPIHHRMSGKRSWRRMDIYVHRNEQLISWLYFPLPYNLVYMAGYAAKAVARGVRIRRPANTITGVLAGVRACIGTRRRPISRAAFRFDQFTRARLRAGDGVTLAEAESRLRLPGPPPKPPAGGWPRPVRALHAPLRGLRGSVIGAIGRPVRCEVCGEVLFRGVPLVWRGRVKLLGAETAFVRVDWDKMNRLTFRHVERDRCRKP